MCFSATSLVDEIWENRPPTGATEIFLHEDWAGKGIAEKIGWIRDKIKEKNGEAAVFTDLG